MGCGADGADAYVAEGDEPEGVPRFEGYAITFHERFPFGFTDKEHSIGSIS